MPLLMVFYNLGTKEAIAISGFTQLLGSTTRYIVTFNDRHPTKDAVCIDYGISNVMLPTVLIGSVCGIFFNLAMPAAVTLICLTVLLIFLTIQSLRKGLEIYAKENSQLAELAKKPSETENELVAV